MRLLTRAACGVCSVALFAVAMWLTNVKPHLDGRLQNPITTQGRIGAVVANPMFSVKVTRVDVASSLVKQGDSKRMSTPWIFVIVYLNVQSNGKPINLGHVRLLTRGGLSYSESGRSSIFTDPAPFEPLLWRSTYYVFEIPKDRLAGARFVVGLDTILNNLSAETEVDLGLGDSETARLLAHPAAGYVLRQS